MDSLTGRLVSLNVGVPEDIVWEGQTYRTSIVKEPVPDHRLVRRLGVEGDRQANLKVHGGVDKAVYAYPSEHYPFWRAELPDEALPWGSFGENLSLEGFLEDAVALGDRFRVGDAVLAVSQPRMPCANLNVRFRRGDLVKRFLASRRSGFYLRVEGEGTIGVGDAVERVPGDGEFSVRRLVEIVVDERPDRALVEELLRHPELAEAWKERLRKRLA